MIEQDMIQQETASTVTTTTISVEDIQPSIKSEYRTNMDVKIRKAWVAIMPEEIKEKIKDILRNADSETKDAYYKGIDDEVSDTWLEMMRTYAENHKNSMVKAGNGDLRLSDEHCNKTDEIIIVAAEKVVNGIIQNMS